MAGFSLLEVSIGLFILALIVQGAYVLSHTSIQANATGRDLSKAAVVLKDFIEEVRRADMDSHPRNTETTDTTEQCAIKWIVYDETSAGGYAQPPGLLLVCARLTYVAANREHSVETSTLLGRK
jgi:prepilin-type N-terminal cleavage/methylation domain-containing protein